MGYTATVSMWTNVDTLPITFTSPNTSDITLPISAVSSHTEPISVPIRRQEWSVSLVYCSFVVFLLRLSSLPHPGISFPVSAKMWFGVVQMWLYFSYGQISLPG